MSDEAGSVQLDSEPTLPVGHSAPLPLFSIEELDDSYGDMASRLTDEEEDALLKVGRNMTYRLMQSKILLIIRIPLEVFPTGLPALFGESFNYLRIFLKKVQMELLEVLVKVKIFSYSNPADIVTHSHYSPSYRCSDNSLQSDLYSFIRATF